MANILIADDDKDIIRMLRFYLEKEEFQIFEAYDRNMTFMILQNYGIDVVLVDIMMPHMDGFDLIQKVRRTMDVPILVSRQTVNEFISNHNTHLTVMENGEHWFHTDEQLAFLDTWMKKAIG